LATLSLSEIVNKTTSLPTREEKIDFLKKNNSQSLRTIMSVMFDKENFKWNIPSDSVPPYKPSPHVESQGMLYRQTRKLRYFIKGYDGDRLNQYRREFLFIELLESIDKEDAKLMELVLLQQPPKGLTADIINESLGLNLPVVTVTEQPTRGRKPKNGKKAEEV
jgi:hypothetical protein